MLKLRLVVDQKLNMSSLYKFYRSKVFYSFLGESSYISKALTFLHLQL